MIPVLLTGIAFVRGRTMNKHFKTLGGYISNIEADFRVKGWE